MGKQSAEVATTRLASLSKAGSTRFLHSTPCRAIHMLLSIRKTLDEATKPDDLPDLRQLHHRRSTKLYFVLITMLFCPHKPHIAAPSAGIQQTTHSKRTKTQSLRNKPARRTLWSRESSAGASLGNVAALLLTGKSAAFLLLVALAGEGSLALRTHSSIQRRCGLQTELPRHRKRGQDIK